MTLDEIYQVAGYARIDHFPLTPPARGFVANRGSLRPSAINGPWHSIAHFFIRAVHRFPARSPGRPP
jgi:hypothetical protein